MYEKYGTIHTDVPEIRSKCIFKQSLKSRIKRPSTMIMRGSPVYKKMILNNGPLLAAIFVCKTIHYDVSRVRYKS